ncbi:ribosome maturation factor [Balneolaceae bacterium ANBcel3]|nr:ribosome maturation factor [Balneolaceae bacterium ANBcel3]
MAEQVLTGTDLYLVEAELKGSSSNYSIWIYLEAEKGNISLDQCAKISRELKLLLDADGWHEKKYTLNVSSPGLDRPLRDRRQYLNNIGRIAVIRYTDGDETRSAEGKLEEVQEEKVLLNPGSGKDAIQIPFSEIQEARIQPSFK